MLRIDRIYHRFMRSKVSGLFPVFRTKHIIDAAERLLPHLTIHGHA
jgi:hypothetical protein